MFEEKMSGDSDYKPNGPVFPVHLSEKTYHGLYTKEFFAAVAMHGILANPTRIPQNTTTLAKSAVDCAEDLIDELKKRGFKNDKQ